MLPSSIYFLINKMASCCCDRKSAIWSITMSVLFVILIAIRVSVDNYRKEHTNNEIHIPKLPDVEIHTFTMLPSDPHVLAAEYKKWLEQHHYSTAGIRTIRDLFSKSSKGTDDGKTLGL